jgi:glycosyltransferase involved in cell wall biosynthesis
MKPVPPRPAAPRVLVLSGLQIYPTLSGGNLRSFAVANALKHNGLEVFVYSLVGRKKDYLARRPSAIQVWPDGIEEYVDRGPLGFLVGYGSYGLGLPPAWLTAYLRVASSSPREFLMPALLREKLRWCDAVVSDFPFVHPAFGAASARGRFHVLSTHNIEQHLYEDRSRWQNRWMRSAVRRIELAAAEAADVLVTCCEADRQFFEAHARVRRSIVVPNGIDLRRFRILGEEERTRARAALGISDDIRLFLFTASRYGPNREAFDYLLAFAREQGRLLAERGIHILVVGSVVAEPVRFRSFTATGKVDVVEPYFAAADAAINPISSGAGTNVKMCEFIAARLPIVTTSFGARGFRITDGRTGFLFERDDLASVLSEARRLFDADPARLRGIAEEAYRQNESAIDMDVCIRPLAEAVSERNRSARADPGGAEAP